MILGAGKMAQKLRAPDALSKDFNLIPNNYKVAHKDL